MPPRRHAPSSLSSRLRTSASMLGLVVAPLSGIEFVASPMGSSRVHKRAELSATLRAPWDINLENIIDNVKLAWSCKVRAKGHDTPQKQPAYLRHSLGVAQSVCLVFWLT